MALYMVIEDFKDGAAAPIYARFAARGRLAPPGLRYVNSWVTKDLRRCYQVMETTDRSLFVRWIESWSDLADFEIIEVISSSDAAERFA